MPNWESLVDRAGLETLLTGKYAPYAWPISGALGVFLEGLPGARQTAVLVQQASLPAAAAISRRLVLLARSCPVLHKLGQILARDRRLAPEFRAQLQTLESLQPSFSAEALREMLERELGRLDRLGIVLGPRPLAEASVAVVTPFRFASAGRNREVRDGVFKILKPGIEERLEEELDLLERVGAYLDKKCEDFSIPRLSYRESFERVREKLRNEVRLDLEQEHLRLAGALYEQDRRVKIPALLPFCTPRITAMERIRGIKITLNGPGEKSEGQRWAGLVIEALLTRSIFSRSDRALFHGDPHAGNLFLTEDGRLAILDWSLAGMLDERERVLIWQIMLGAMMLDPERIFAVLPDLSLRRCLDLDALRHVVCGAVGQIRTGCFPGLLWLAGLLDAAFERAGLHFNADLMLLRKTLHMLEGLAADLGADRNMFDRVFMESFLGHFTAELPRRWLSPPFSRDFAVRFSNADLMEFMANLPRTATRFWAGAALQRIDTAIAHS